MFASGFRDPRFLLTAPNGGIFVSEGCANQIKVIRGAHAGSVQVFTERGLNKPFGMAFYPTGDDPQFLYVANTDGLIRFPYRNGDLKVRGPAEKLAATLSGELSAEWRPLDARHCVFAGRQKDVRLSRLALQQFR